MSLYSIQASNVYVRAVTGWGERSFRTFRNLLSLADQDNTFQTKTGSALFQRSVSSRPRRSGGETEKPGEVGLIKGSGAEP